jgi:three-Cys-motif partner protein
MRQGVLTYGEEKANMSQMDEEQLGSSSGGEELEHLKRVSRVKHVILEKYFPPWARILGSRNSQLVYVDCFAGPGQYEMDGNSVEGSPVIAVREAAKLVQRGAVQNLLLYLVDEEPEQIERLKVRLSAQQPYPSNLTVKVNCANSRFFVPNLLPGLGSQMPAFFFIDPYGHPLPLPVIRKILIRQRTEVLINLMWFQINRDLNNPEVESRLNDLFGDKEWQKQTFMTMRGPEREKAFVLYFSSQLECRYVFPFKVRYDVEDMQAGRRTKYYLLHASNHPKAALLMKEVMWPLGDEEGTFAYSGGHQPLLISERPTEQELRDALLERFRAREITFDQLLEETWNFRFIPKQYRAVLRQMEGKEITITRITSAKTGIGGSDRIRFN